VPSTNIPDEALSATVSANLMSHPAMRLSTISTAATAYSIERMISAIVTCGDVRSRPMQNAISPSTRGCNSVSAGISSHSAMAMSANSMP
jgi:hypothetical protein